MPYYLRVCNDCDVLVRDAANPHGPEDELCESTNWETIPLYTEQEVERRVAGASPRKDPTDAE